MASDWWSKRLSNPKPTPQQYPSSVPPSTPPIRIGQQIRFPQAQPNTTQQVLDNDRPPTGEVDMGSAIRLWKGGEAHRKEGDMRCPECGSQHVFGRVARAGNTTIQGKSPAPRCFECGWTGLYTQGDQANWGV